GGHGPAQRVGVAHVGHDVDDRSGELGSHSGQLFPRRERIGGGVGSIADVDGHHAPARRGEPAGGGGPDPAGGPGHQRDGSTVHGLHMPRVKSSGTSTSPASRSWIDALPSPYSVLSMPCRRISSTLCTPRSPPAARPHRYARPISTAFAPSASALTTSLPRRMPPSSSTSICPP